MTRPLIVGDPADGHVRAVLDALNALGVRDPMVLDGPSLQRDGFSVTLEQVIHKGVSIGLEGGRGWLRRYAPSEWGIGTVAGSLEAARRSFLGLIGSISRVGSRRWLTSLGPLLHAEDKLVQLHAARSLGIRAPNTIVTSNGEEARATLERFVVKPLVGGYFVDEHNQPRAVFTELVRGDEISKLDFGHAPFLAQEVIEPVRHLRIVTVEGQAWTGVLQAGGLPIDWRADAETHRSWVRGSDPEAEEHALRMTQHLDLGYSSQDWIVDDDGPVFVDLNPAGQWLFLPDDVAESVTHAIARFLAG